MRARNVYVLLGDLALTKKLSGIIRCPWSLLTFIESVCVTGVNKMDADPLKEYSTFFRNRLILQLNC